MRLWRIAGAFHTVWSGEGARLRGGRWNPPGLPAIYAGTSYAIAALEILVHTSADALPANLLFVHADLPPNASIEHAAFDTLAWDGPNLAAPQAYGKAWLLERRSLVLLIPSVVTRGLDWNALINPLHPDFTSIEVSPETPASWDTRLRIPSH
jgi:RES domain-containing protein